ncbi:MAG: hypothetical protein NVSMB9_13680 [Isosphaeraceae bacterium]
MVRQKSDEEPSAAEVAGLGVCDREREGCRHGRIHGVAPLPKDVSTDVRGLSLLRNDHVSGERLGLRRPRVAPSAKNQEKDDPSSNRR